jgi:hypothetical protein
VSSELERQLREARESLPDPGHDVTERARARALGALRRRRPRVRVAALMGVAFVVVLVAGVGLGSLVAPSGTASQGPPGLGFLPEDGWYVMQAGTDATPEHPGIAIASNIPLAPEDGASIVPYSTLLRLPADGIVIVANFTGRVEQVQRFVPKGSHGSTFPVRKLPLRVIDASPYIQFGGQVRPEEPLGQYQLRAEVNSYTVDLHFYFGTTAPSANLRAAAQRQLDRLVVRSGRSRQGARSRDTESTLSRPSTGSAGLIDRTFVCSTDAHGGIHEVEARAHAGYRVDSRWARLPYAVVATGGAGGALSGNQSASPNSLAWITAGSPAADTTVDSEYETFPVRVSGTLGIRRGQCKATRARVPLSRAGLRGGPMTALGEELDCVAPRRVLLRVRARLQSQGNLKQRQLFLATNVPLLDAKLTVRTLAGKPLVYAEVFQSGRTPLYTARGCVRD